MIKLDYKLSETEIKMLKYLQKEYPVDHNIQEIADAVSVHRNTVSQYIMILERFKLIKHTRTYTSSKLYTVTEKFFNEVSEKI
ncbi:MAG: HTH domain-containing protein [Candidatus Lokiarchaeota archaeon]|nr:HTH domain-containing protein [Candidatus Lokiarchaeota archaeon]